MRQTYRIQNPETNVLQAGELLASAASQTGEDIADLAERIVTNATAYRAVSALMAGLRRKTVTMIDAADTPEDVADAMTSLKAGLSALA